VTAFELPDGLVIHTVNGEPVEGIDESAWGEAPSPIWCYDDLPLEEMLKIAESLK